MSAAVRPHVLIRAMQSADLKAVAAVEKAAYVYPWSLGIFRDCMLAGYHCMVLDVDGHVGGYGIMSIAASEAHLLNICVHPDWQSLGYGRRMLNALLNRAGQAGAETVFLEVRPSNSVALEPVSFGRLPSYRRASRLLSGRRAGARTPSCLRCRSAPPESHLTPFQSIRHANRAS
jgi:[ribosomal protein S18]-alanine N-acetyltransferase